MAEYLDMYAGQQAGGQGLRMPLTAPTPTPDPTPPIRPGPPTTPEELQNRKSGWAAFSERLQNDPTFSLALMRFGTSLMQPVPPGQTPLGQAGYALQDSMNFFLTQQAERRRAEGELVAQKNVQERTNLEARRTAEQERTGDVTRRRGEQQIAQDTTLFPLTQQKLQGEIDRQKDQGRLNDAQADWLREQIKQYPREIDARLRQARASEISAGKPTSVDMFEAVVQAHARAKGISVDQARSDLGADYYGRASGKGSAGAQTLQQIRSMMEEANPKGADETPEAYRSRISQQTLQYQQQSKRKDYFQQKQDFLKAMGPNIFAPEDLAKFGAEFDRDWEASHGEKPPTSPSPVPGPGGAAAPPSAAPPTRTTVGRQEVIATARNRGIPIAQVEAQLRQRGVTIDESK